VRINLIMDPRGASLPLSCEGGRSRGGRDRPRRTRFGGRGKQPGAQFSKFSALADMKVALLERPRSFGLCDDRDQRGDLRC